MERNSKAPIEKDETNPQGEPDTRLIEKRWFGWAAVVVVLCAAAVLLIWWMPAKVDSVVEGFHIGDRTARFRAAPGQPDGLDAVDEMERPPGTPGDPENPGSTERESSPSSSVH